MKLEYLNQRSLPAEIRLGYDYKGNLDFSEALRLARQADVVIFCGGLDGSIELEGRATRSIDCLTVRIYIDKSTG